MISQFGYHIHWEKQQQYNENCLYFKIPSDLIFDPYEFPQCLINGQDFDLELSKEAWPHSLDIWCPPSIQEIRFLCRYQNSGGKCKAYYPVATDCLVIPNDSLLNYEVFTIPIKDMDHYNTVIYGTVLYFIFISFILIKKINF